MGLRIGPGSWAAVIFLKPTVTHRRDRRERTVSMYSNRLFDYPLVKSVAAGQATTAGTVPGSGCSSMACTCRSFAWYALI